MTGAAESEPIHQISQITSPAAPLEVEAPVQSTIPTQPSSDLPFDLGKVITANAPVIYLHKRERYKPCTVQFFLENSRLVSTRTNPETEVIPLGSVTIPKLLEATSRARNEGSDKNNVPLRLVLNPNAQPGQELEKGGVHPPLWVHVKKVIRRGAVEAIEINYLTFYAFNGPLRLFGCGPLWLSNAVGLRDVGIHDADWEHVTVRIDPVNGNVLGVFYGSHGFSEGEWVAADKVPRTNEGRPIVYSSLFSHAAYPYAGCIPRVLGVASDITSSTRSGQLWRPMRCILVNPNPESPNSLTKIRTTVQSRGVPPKLLGGTSYSITTGSDNGVRVETVDPKLDWSQYLGRWGSIPAPNTTQRWFTGAEERIGKGFWARVFNFGDKWVCPCFRAPQEIDP